MDRKKQDIITKVKAMLRLADPTRNDAKGEIANAMRMARKLLEKHNLSMAELGDLDDNNNPANPTNSIREHTLSQKAMAKWEQHLCHVIDCLLDIDHFLRETVERNDDPRSSVRRSYVRRKRVVFLGNEMDCAIACEMFHIFKKEMREFYRQARKQYPGLDQNRYCLGMVHYMFDVADKMRYEDMSDADKNKYGALVVVKKDAIDKYKEKLGLRTSKGRPIRLTPDFLAGHADGAKMNLRVPKRTIK